MRNCVIAKRVVQNVTLSRRITTSNLQNTYNYHTRASLQQQNDYEPGTDHVETNDERLPVNSRSTSKNHNLSEPTLPFPIQSSSTQPHHDLESFLNYANRIKLSKSSTVYRGTYFEYLTQKTLKRYGFQLNRVGGRLDNGIDLIGYWNPYCNTSIQKSIKVLIQCKRLTSTKNGPSNIREIEGSFIGAPTEWRGLNTMGILVGTNSATKGVLNALSKSRRPLGWICIDTNDNDDDEDNKTGEGGRGEKGGGRVKQILWNQKANEIGLIGFDVVMKYDVEGNNEVVLMYKGKVITEEESKGS